MLRGVLMNSTYFTIVIIMITAQGHGMVSWLMSLDTTVTLTMDLAHGSGFVYGYGYGFWLACSHNTKVSVH
jgi:hypothetical protein